MKSTEAQFRDFTSSLIWQDLRLAILTRLSAVRNDLEFMPLDAGPLEGAYARGRASELRFLADLPGELITQVERGDIKWQTEVAEEEELDQLEQEELPNLEQKDRLDK